MKPVRTTIIVAITFLIAMALFSVALFTKCRCSGKRFSPDLCLIGEWTPGVRAGLPTCRENLIQLEAAKYEWARESGAQPGAEVTWDELRTYLGGSSRLRCRRGGHYVLGAVGEEPDCIGACRLHADPLEHALEPAILYASRERPPLASSRATFERGTGLGDADGEAIEEKSTSGKERADGEDSGP